MIQRKQTIYMLLALAALIVCLCLPIGYVTSHSLGTGDIDWYNLGTFTNGKLNAHPLLFVDLVVTGTLTLIDIFLYNKRSLQAKICVANIILCLVWYGYYAFAATTMDSLEGGTFHVCFAVCLPAVAIILLFLARRGIKADEELIKSMDRIR